MDADDNTTTSTIMCATLANSPNGPETGNDNIICTEFDMGKQNLPVETTINEPAAQFTVLANSTGG